MFLNVKICFLEGFRLNLYFNYSQFHKNLPKSSLQLHWISVKFYEMDDIKSVGFRPFWIYWYAYKKNYKKNIYLFFCAR